MFVGIERARLPISHEHEDADDEEYDKDNGKDHTEGDDDGVIVAGDEIGVWVSGRAEKGGQRKARINRVGLSNWAWWGGWMIGICWKWGYFFQTIRPLIFSTEYIVFWFNCELCYKSQEKIFTFLYDLNPLFCPPLLSCLNTPLKLNWHFVLIRFLFSRWRRFDVSYFSIKAN